MTEEVTQKESFLLRKSEGRGTLEEHEF